MVKSGVEENTSQMLNLITSSPSQNYCFLKKVALFKKKTSMQIKENLNKTYLKKLIIF